MQAINGFKSKNCFSHVIRILKVLEKKELNK